ncbi:MAG TPA: hypothetical protein VLX91_08415 [Candidatus Acidoferrales bacterium]|nr:hypothetical protein [Candidatus Acidoferrales bacterium]
MTTLNGWENFYIIVGSSAGALIGLQFVVITLIDRASRPAAEAGAAFATPSVVHFGAVLLLSAIVSVPWDGITAASVLWGLVGFCGFVYAAVVARRMRAQTAYRPVFEDWLFHALLPLAAYTLLALSAFFADSHTARALLGVGASSLLLLFIGIHNAWDSATYNIFVGKRR